LVHAFFGWISTGNHLGRSALNSADVHAVVLVGSAVGVSMRFLVGQPAYANIVHELLYKQR
jgi:hypothetical protein